ncbi:MAG: hypothetical protein ACLFQX_13300 [Candidatus Kapaibacterium sp.]
MKIALINFLLIICFAGATANDGTPKSMEYLDFGDGCNHLGIKGFNLYETQADDKLHEYFTSALYYERSLTENFGLGISANLAVGLPALEGTNFNQADNLIIPALYVKYYALHSQDYMLGVAANFSTIRGNTFGTEINNLTQLDLRIPFIYYPMGFVKDNNSFNVFANAGIAYHFQFVRGVPFLEVGVGIDSWLRLSVDVSSLLRDNTLPDHLTSLSMKH